MRLVDIRLVRDRDDRWRASSADATPRLYAVTSCGSCPMFDGTRWCRADAKKTLMVSEREVHAECPLRAGPAVVVVAEGA